MSFLENPAFRYCWIFSKKTPKMGSFVIQSCQNFVWCDFAGNTFLGRVNELGRRYKINIYSLKTNLIQNIIWNSVHIFRANYLKFLLYSLKRWVIGNCRKIRKHEKRESEWVELPGMNILERRRAKEKSNTMRHLLHDFIRKIHFEHVFGRNLQYLLFLTKLIFSSLNYSDDWIWDKKDTCLCFVEMHIFSFFQGIWISLGWFQEHTKTFEDSAWILDTKSKMEWIQTFSFKMLKSII